uniref:Phospholipid/glycerol acyltransferase domain-containing protein n=1 Tax=Romanomermis culicivorax TaxID=13658 RepID=A0A915K3F2_ROMCU
MSTEKSPPTKERERVKNSCCAYFYATLKETTEDCPMIRRLKGYLFALLLASSSFLGSIFVLYPLMPILLIWPKRWRIILDRVVGFWEILVVAYLKYISGVECRIHGDKISSNEKAIIIMNHRTRLDWMFFWNALSQMNPWLLTTEKIILKSDLKKIYGASWAMQANGFIFLDRNWETDESLLRNGCKYLVETGNTYQILLFPEGTDYCVRSRIRSQEYSSANNLPVLTHLLQPRITGLSCVIAELLKKNSLDCIYDVTIAFPDEIVQTEIDLICKGRCPSKVDFKVKKYPIETLDFNLDMDLNEMVTDWCRKLWHRKDTILSNYYSDDEEKRSFASKRIMESEGVRFYPFLLIFTLLFWSIMTILWVYLVICYFWAKMFLISGILLFVLSDLFFGGFDAVIKKLSMTKEQA